MSKKFSESLLALCLPLCCSLTLIVFSFLSISKLHAGQHNHVMDIGDTMPVFTDLPSISGDSLSSSDIDESIIVLVALANHCPWVQGMDHQLVALSQQFSDKSVRIVGFSVNHREDDRLPAMKVHAAENGYQFDYLYDESQKLGRDLGATRTPEYFVFNEKRELAYMGRITNSPAMKRDGEIRFIDGTPNEFYVADAISSLLVGSPVVVSETRAHGCSVKYKSKGS